MQWARVAKGQPSNEKPGRPRRSTPRTPPSATAAGLSRLTVTRDADGSWTIADKDWNHGAGGTVTFTDTTTTSFSRLVLVGTKNFDEQVFNSIVLTRAGRPTDAARPHDRRPGADFLGQHRGRHHVPRSRPAAPRTVEMVRYAGFRWVRGGIEGLRDQGPTTLQTYLDLHQQAGARFSWGLVSGGTDLEKLIETARPLAEAGALLAFEGNNEPNNWGVTYQGENGRRTAPSWLAVAKLQRDLYQAVKRDPALRSIRSGRSARAGPRWTTSACSS